MKQVTLKLRSIQTIEGEGSEETELMTEGTMEQKDGVWLITYQESEATGFEGSTTRIHVQDNAMVSIARKGTVQSCLTIETGKKHYCLYDLPYGSMTVGIFTHKIESSLSQSGGQLYLKYTIDVNSAYISDNEIYLDVTVK